MSRMKRIFVAVSSLFFNALYWVFRLMTRRVDEVVFLSQQADEPSYDYCALAKAFESLGWRTSFFTRKVRRGGSFAYCAFAVHEIALLARCRVCVVDRYDPVVSLLNFECEPAGSIVARWGEFPACPIVVQLWHAFGAFKKFGYQALDVAEGHSSEEAALFKIHRNYSWIVCSGEGTREAFAEAFGYPLDRVLPFSRPTQRRMMELAAQQRAGGFVLDDVVLMSPRKLPTIVFAPTVRKYDKTIHPFRDLEAHSAQLFASVPFDVKWEYHPLESDQEASGGVPTHLLEADYVVTDYSSIVYEAYLLRKRVAFYIPDIIHYRMSPGLNIDPEQQCPGLVAHTEKELCNKLVQWSTNPESYPQHQLDCFIGKAFDGASSNPADDLARYISKMILNSNL